MRLSRRLFAERLRLIGYFSPYRDAPRRYRLRAILFTLREALLGDRLTFTACGGRRFASPANNISSFIAAVYGERDVHIVRFWQRHLRPGSVFFDVGANIGLYTVSASNRIGAAGSTVAFEAHPRIFAFLERNVARNCRHPVVVENLAVGAETGSTRIAYNASNPGQSRVARGAQAGDAVGMVTLDDYCASRGIGAIDYLKIDVEGYETHVLRGARAIVAASPDILIQTEFDPKHLSTYGRAGDLAELLLGWGMRPHSIGWHDGVPRPLDTLENFSGEVVWSWRALA